jgi:predicted dehydrogenase
MTGTGLRWGLLGAARISPAAIVDPVRAVGDRLVAIAARERTRAETFARHHGVETVHDSYESVIEASDVDAIYNPLPHGLHGYWNRRALAAGKHLLAEKPFAANGDEAREVAETARGSGLVVMEAFHYYYHPVANRMRELMASGELGDVRRVEASFAIPPPAPDDLRWDPRLAGGAAMDLGCYCLHALRSLAPWAGGDPAVLRAAAVVREGLTGVDEQMEAELRFPSGIEGIAAWSMARPARSATLRLIGTRGEATATEFVEPHLDDRVIVRSHGRERTEHLGTCPTYRYQMAAFSAALDSERPSVATGVDDAVKNMQLIDQCYVAAGLHPRLPTPPHL